MYFFCSSSDHVQGIYISVALWNTAQNDFPVLISALSFHPIYQFIYKLFVTDNLFESELCQHQRYLKIFLDMSSSILSICTFKIYAQTEIPNAVLNWSETHAHSIKGFCLQDTHEDIIILITYIGFYLF